MRSAGTSGFRKRCSNTSAPRRIAWLLVPPLQGVTAVGDFFFLTRSCGGVSMLVRSSRPAAALASGPAAACASSALSLASALLFLVRSRIMRAFFSDCVSFCCANCALRAAISASSAALSSSAPIGGREWPPRFCVAAYEWLMICTVANCSCIVKLLLCLIPHVTKRYQRNKSRTSESAVVQGDEGGRRESAERPVR